MAETWFISDTHFGHHNIVHKFKRDDGSPLRPFSSLEEMDEAMVENWNKVVSNADRIYHLGDVAMNRKCLSILGRLNGRKVLIKGNHDIFKLKDYTPYFDDIRSYKMYPKHGIICSHIPVHEQQLQYRWGYNVHGHLHANKVLCTNSVNGYKETGEFLTPDLRYINVCVEHTNYMPVHFEDILEEIELRKEIT